MVRIVLLLLMGVVSTAASAQVIRPRVVILAYFEVGADTGDQPGELQYWVEREHLDRVVPVHGAFRDARTNAEGSILAMRVGPANLHPAINVTALGLDPKFDLSQSYWLIAGIAGISPQKGTIGSAVWTDYVVNGDLAHEIDAREIPPDWPTGYFLNGKSRPYE